jgi:hypothetical protein
MSTAVAMAPTAGQSARFKAKIAGVSYLLTILTSSFAELVRGKLVVSGDAGATAANILAHQRLLHLGFAFDVIAGASYIAVTAVFYGLFKPVNRGLSLLAAFFSLVGCAIGAVGASLGLAPLVVLGNAPYTTAFKMDQLRALALLLLKLRAQTANVGIVFFGFYCLLIGYLIVRSSFLPRALGVLMAIAGLGWLTFLSPPLANDLVPFNLLSGLLGEGSLTVWLLLIGVDARRWQEQASAAAGEWRTMHV